MNNDRQLSIFEWLLNCSAEAFDYILIGIKDGTALPETCEAFDAILALADD